MISSIVHLSDWHGQLPKGKLPKASLYVVTGDMLKNYSKGHDIDTFAERAGQARFIRQHSLRDIFGDPDAPVVCIRGNHEFINLSSWIGGPVYEIGLEPNIVFNVLGYKFAGFRGINRVSFPGEVGWSDEMDVHEINSLAEKLSPDIHFLVTHSPAEGILDRVPGPFGKAEHIGLRGLSRYINKQVYQHKSLIAHFSGHVHEDFGYKVYPGLETGGYSFSASNAATGYILYSLKDGKLVPELFERLLK